MKVVNRWKYQQKITVASLVWISVTVRRKRNNLRMCIRHLLVVVVVA